MNKHTPGPWRWSGASLRAGSSIHDSELDVILWAANAITDFPVNWSERLGSCGNSAEMCAEYNARLISASPDLLEALKYVVAVYEHGTCGHTVEIAFNQCRAAIAKATGETK